MPTSLYRFAENLRSLLTDRSAEDMLASWDQLRLEPTGYAALGMARKGYGPEPLLAEVDRLLWSAMKLVAELSGNRTPATLQLKTFRYAALERWQCAASAALVERRYGVAGLHSLIEDRNSPLARRYFAFLCLAERHDTEEWSFFKKYLGLNNHHALVATAVEALRFYPDHQSSHLLMRMFEEVKRDDYLRRFFGPRILQSLYVLEDSISEQLFRELLVVGHTEADPVVCEVSRAIVMIHRLTDEIPDNSKCRNEAETANLIPVADAVYDGLRADFMPITVI